MSPYTSYYVESCMATLVAFKRRLVGRHLNPLVVHFQHSRPHGTDAYESFFRCDEHFNAERNCVVYPCSAE
ncbi:MAG: AraC family transcriptional regulator ligand-binding domain-containing protein [Calditrichaceae bacterium]